MKNSISPAKITAPVLGDIVHRERLYKIFDEGANTPIICISAPAGYGKTTLVNAYIENRELPCLWYKIDAGDSDISTFFYHLGLAVKKATANKKSMPLLKPEYQLGIPAFTMHYFRELFSRLTPDSMVVFDNYQDVGKDSLLHDIIQEAIQDVPHDCRLVFISREEPPCSFAKSNANGEVLKINSELLAFTYEESLQAAQLLGINKKTDVALLKKIHSCTKGWVTGFKLLLNRKDELKDIGIDLEVASQDIVFEYFMGEVLNRIDPETKMFLFQVSILPVINISLAKQLTGLADTKKILNDLVKKQFFTTRHGRFRSTYDFHPLFHKFLVEQCEENLGQSELEDIYNTSGLLLADAGDYESAIELLMRSDSWDVIIKLLVKHSKKLIDQGRNLQLKRWVEKLPTEKVRDEVWINYWYGMALLNYENDAAREVFIRAYNLSKQHNDIQGLYLSWCGIADSFIFSRKNFTDAIPWMDELQWLKLNFPKIPSLEARGKLIFSEAMLLTSTDPASPDLISLINKIEILYRIVPSRKIKILSATQLVIYYGHRGEVAKIRQLSISLNKYIIDNKISDSLTLFLEAVLVACDYSTANFQLTNEKIDLAHERFRNAGLNFLNCYVLSSSLHHAELKGDIERVKLLLEKYRDDVNDDSDMDLMHYHYHEAIYSTMKNDIGEAIQHIQLATERAKIAHSLLGETLCRSFSAYIYAESNQYKLALEELEFSGLVFQSFNSYSGMVMNSFIRSWIALNQNDHDLMKRHLTEALDMAYVKDIRSIYLWPHKMISKLCALALENNIRPEFVKQIIKIYNYTPEKAQYFTEKWPYPIKIYTLNRFEIVKDGQILRLSDKNQQFIKALIAFGGRDVHEETLSDALWPDAEGDAAHQNFATTLHRVRKSVGSDVIRLQQNRVSLDPNYCWIDIWALKRHFVEIEQSLLNSKHLLIELTERAISLYEGPFLGAGENEYWMLSTREKLSNKFLKMLLSSAESFSQSKEYKQALGCYQKALEIDDLSENIYQGLMYCHMQSGHRSEGIVAYTRCCERLNSSLGIEPSSKTEKLYQALKDS